MSAFAPSSFSTTFRFQSNPCNPLCNRRLPYISRSSHRDIARNLPRAQKADLPPDFSSGFEPAIDNDYAEVRVLSLGPSRTDGSLLTLRPVKGGDRAFKMSVTVSQADSIRQALSRRHTTCRPLSLRPGTHDLCKNVLDVCGAFVTKAAITHIQDEVFIARVWVRGPGCTNEEMNVDARPSDAIAMAIRASAPLFLNTMLLQQWNVPVEAVERDAKHGLCDWLGEYPDAMKSIRSIREEVRQRPEHLKLAKLKMELDLAVRLQRFGEACALKEEIMKICPIDRLKEDLQLAVREQRFMDAARIQDHITIWKARLRMWEKGAIDLENFTGEEERYI